MEWLACNNYVGIISGILIEDILGILENNCKYNVHTLQKK